MTGVEVWAPAFHWLTPDTLTRKETIADFRDGHWCRLCESSVPAGAVDDHVKLHRAELRTWRRTRSRQLARESTQRLRQVSRLRAETRGRS